MPFLSRLIEKNPRLVVGLMSGTSLDGVDATVAEISGSGKTLSLSMRSFVSTPYDDALRAAILRNSEPDSSSVLEISQLNARLPHAYADAVRAAVDEAGLSVKDVDLVGCHGQTIHHLPIELDSAGLPTRSTLQIGDPSVLANLLQVPVVGDFRTADMALGGQGAPLVPYFDYVCFRSDAESRGLLNLGGIGNLTLLPQGCALEDVVAFDTGPGNMVIDLLTRHHFDLPYDRDGALAAQGEVDHALLAEILNRPYFAQEPPKSTGREAFGESFAREVGLFAMNPHDALATATALTAYAVYQAYARFLRDQTPLDALIVSGGGIHNRTLMEVLERSFSPITVRTTEAYGIDPDAKEALCFAVLAHETLNGVPTNLPSVTGATRPAILGKICVVTEE